MNFGIKASTVRQFLISSGLPSKKAIQIVNQTLNELKVEKHPDKTFIGRIAKGFDFLGYSFEPKGLSIAPKTLANFLERITQLYEQGADHRRTGQYVKELLACRSRRRRHIRIAHHARRTSRATSSGRNRSTSRVTDC